MGYEVVLFDADGTLFDFAHAESYALREAFREFDLQFLPEHLVEYKIINREVWRRFERGEISSTELRTLRFRQFCERIGVEVDPERFSSRYLHWLAQAAFLLGRAREVVETLSGKCRLAVVTNGLSDVQRGRFNRSPIRDHFEALVISEEVGVQKPDPAIFEHTLGCLEHSDKETVLMVGDSLSSDIQGGINFGIDTCWLNPAGEEAPTRLTPRYVVQELDEVLPLCLSSGGAGG